jgi:hypothetical protein
MRDSSVYNDGVINLIYKARTFRMKRPRFVYLIIRCLSDKTS